MLYNTAVQSHVMLLDANMEALHLTEDTCHLKGAGVLDTLTLHLGIRWQCFDSEDSADCSAQYTTAMQ